MKWSAARRKEASERARAAWDAKKEQKEIIVDRKIDPPEPVEPAPITPSLDAAYEQGFRDCAERILNSLGLTLTPHDGEAGSMGSRTQATHAAREEWSGAAPAAPPSPPPPPPPPPSSMPAYRGPVCGWCGHTQEMHEPLSAKACFDHDCKCTGFTTRAPVKIGSMRFKRG